MTSPGEPKSRGHFLFVLSSKRYANAALAARKATGNSDHIRKVRQKTQGVQSMMGGNGDRSRADMANNQY